MKLNARSKLKGLQEKMGNLSLGQKLKLGHDMQKEMEPTQTLDDILQVIKDQKTEDENITKQIDKFIYYNKINFTKAQNNQLLIQILSQESQFRSIDQCKFIYEQLKNIPFIIEQVQDHGHQYVLEILKDLQYEQIQKKSFLYKQGLFGDKMFILLSGQAACFQQESSQYKKKTESMDFIHKLLYQNNPDLQQLVQNYQRNDMTKVQQDIVNIISNNKNLQFIKFYQKMNHFGFSSLITQDQKRTETVYQFGKIETITKKKYEKIMQRKRLRDQTTIYDYLLQICFFQDLNKSIIQKMIQNTKKLHFLKGQFILEEGQENNYIYMIISGEINVYLKQEKVAILAPFQYFGEECLVNNKKTMHTYMCNNLVSIYQFDLTKLIEDFEDQEQFLKNLKQQFQIKKKTRIKYLKKKYRLQNKNVQYFKSEKMDLPMNNDDFLNLKTTFKSNIKLISKKQNSQMDFIQKQNLGWTQLVNFKTYWDDKQEKIKLVKKENYKYANKKLSNTYQSIDFKKPQSNMNNLSINSAQDSFNAFDKDLDINDSKYFRMEGSLMYHPDNKKQNNFNLSVKNFNTKYYQNDKHLQIKQQYTQELLIG